MRVPDDVRRTAAAGLELKRTGYDGARALGMRRGRQLVGGSVTVDDLQVMRAWFARHVHTSYPNYVAWQNATDSDRARRGAWRGAVAWMLWGGTPGYCWVLSPEIQKLITRHGDRNGRHLKRFVQPRKGVCRAS